MSTLTLTSLAGGSVSVNGSIVYGTDFYLVRLNHFKLEMADGSDKVYDLGPTKVVGVIVMKNVSYSDGEALRVFLSETCLFDYYRFNISAISKLDLGMGKNTGVGRARYGGGRTLEGVLSYSAPGIYNVKLPYYFIKE